MAKEGSSNARVVGALAAAALTLTAGACSKQSLEDQDQVGAAAGEVMASLDESVDGNATTAFRTPERLRGPL